MHFRLDFKEINNLNSGQTAHRELSDLDPYIGNICQSAHRELSDLDPYIGNYIYYT